MPVNNPYIQKVLKDKDILTDEEMIFSKKGKWSEYFQNTNEIVLEIGTGMGNFFSKLVGENYHKNIIGMEIRYKRLFQSAEKARKIGQNFVLLKAFGQNISEIFERGEISESYIFFPDPWANKDRQRKNRLLQEVFLKDLYTITKKGGSLYFKTDHEEYFDSTLDIIKKQNLWKVEHATKDYENSDIFDMKNITEFEGLYRGHKTAINFAEFMKK